MRPCKPRWIHQLPQFTRYIPEEGATGAEARLGLDMLEALRLVDAEGMSHGAAAAVMDISAPTLCRILNEARKQVASALCHGRPILIEGGNVMVRGDVDLQQGQNTGCQGRGRMRCNGGGQCNGQGGGQGNGNGARQCNRRQGAGGRQCRRGQTGNATPVAADNFPDNK